MRDAAQGAGVARATLATEGPAQEARPCLQDSPDPLILNLGQYFPVVHRWIQGGAEQLFLHTRFWDPPLPQFGSVWELS